MRSFYFFLIYIIFSGSCRSKQDLNTSINRSDFIEIMARSDLFEARFKDLQGQMKDSMQQVEKDSIHREFNTNDSLISQAVIYYAKQNDRDSIQSLIMYRVQQILDQKIDTSSH